MPETGSPCSNSTKIVVWGSLLRSPRPHSWIQGALLLRLLLLRGREGRERGEDPGKLCTPKNSLEYRP